MIRDQRSQGRRAILSGIRKAGSIARVDLAAQTGLSQATVTAITAELLQAGLIEESRAPEPVSDARRGRPRVGLQICGTAHLVGGVKVADRILSAALVDFTGTPVAEASAPMPPHALTGPDLSHAILDVLDRALDTVGQPRSAISALGVGLAGIVDASLGLVHWSPALSDRNTPLRDELAAQIGVPVFIDNDANLVAMAELYFGEGKGAQDFLVVTMEAGVGLGIVLGGAVYRGTRGCGAEFGHTKVSLDGPVCRCGQRGCLEAHVSDYALLREAGIEATDPVQALRDLLDRAQSGDPLANRIVTRARRYFSIGLANLVNIFDPQLIILAGETEKLEYLYVDEVIEAITGLIVQVDMPAPEVVVHRWSDLMWARGAAAYAIEGLAALTLDRLGDDAA